MCEHGADKDKRRHGNGDPVCGTDGINDGIGSAVISHLSTSVQKHYNKTCYREAVQGPGILSPEGSNKGHGIVKSHTYGSAYAPGKQGEEAPFKHVFQVCAHVPGTSFQRFLIFFRINVNTPHSCPAFKSLLFLYNNRK